MAKMTENFLLTYLDTLAHPVAHILAALALAEALHLLSPSTFPLIAVTALLPDLDIFLSSHRTATHSLAALALVAAAAFALARRPAAAAITLAYGSHILVDLLHGNGIRLLWPARQPYALASLQPAWIATAAAALWLVFLLYPALPQPAHPTRTPTPTPTLPPVITRHPPFPIYDPPRPTATPAAGLVSPPADLADIPHPGGCR